MTLLTFIHRSANIFREHQPALFAAGLFKLSGCPLNCFPNEFPCYSNLTLLLPIQPVMCHVKVPLGPNHLLESKQTVSEASPEVRHASLQVVSAIREIYDGLSGSHSLTPSARVNALFSELVHLCIETFDSAVVAKLSLLLI